MRGLTGVDGDSWYPISLSESLEQAMNRLQDALDPERITKTSINYELNGCAGYACRVNPYLVVHAFRLVLLDAFDPSRKDTPSIIDIKASDIDDGIQLSIGVNQAGRGLTPEVKEGEPIRVAKQLLAQTGGTLIKERATESNPVDLYRLDVDFKAPENSL
jgi:hypothetical protein